MRKRLRSGYTTGACAAASAKAATMILLSNISSGMPFFHSDVVDIPFPDGTRVSFTIHGSGLKNEGNTAWASVIKDAGDDPDVTNGAEIMAEMKIFKCSCVSASYNQGRQRCRCYYQAGLGSWNRRACYQPGAEKDDR